LETPAETHSIAQTGRRFVGSCFGAKRDLSSQMLAHGWWRGFLGGGGGEP
jgi:endonuclease YncB( thermonuclease family)